MQIKTLKTSQGAIFDWKSAVFFAVVFFLLYFLDLFWIAVTAPGGKIYSNWIAQFLNYPAWIKNSILFLSEKACRIIDIPAKRSGSSSIDVANGRGIILGYSCYGLQAMDLWMAFILVDKNAFKNKWQWLVFGLAGIWIINFLRISCLIITQYRHSTFFSIINHHTFFNIIAYLLLFSLLIFYYKKKEGTANNGER